MNLNQESVPVKKMKMIDDGMNEEEEMTMITKTHEVPEKLKMERAKNDLVSKRLGELLLKGYKMLNSTCDKCGCINMQKKTEPIYCVACEDPDVLEMDAKIKQLFEPGEFKLDINDSIKEEVAPSENPMLSAVSSSTNAARANMNQFVRFGQDSSASAQPSGLSSTGSVIVTNSVEILKQKIQWAIGELKGSTNVRYNIELCEMIKTASEAIVALRKTDL